MGRRTLLLIAALVVAALGTTGVFLYVNGVDARARAGYETVEILVATAEIPAGITGQQAADPSAIGTREYFADSVDGLHGHEQHRHHRRQGGAGTDRDRRADPRDPVRRARTSPAALPIPDGKLAVSVELGDPARVAGFVGSRVPRWRSCSPPPRPAGPNAGQVYHPGAAAQRRGDRRRGQHSDDRRHRAGGCRCQGHHDVGRRPERGAEDRVRPDERRAVLRCSAATDAKIDPTDPGATAKNLFN